MENRLVLAACLALLPTAASAQQAKFCHVSDAGFTQCHHFTLTSCQQAVRSLGGACAIQAVPDTPRPSVTPIQYPNLAESMRQGQESAARVRLMEAQAAALRAQSREAPQAPRPELNGCPIGYWMLFRCATANGGTELTGEPRVGCTVEQVAPY